MAIILLKWILKRPVVGSRETREMTSCVGIDQAARKRSSPSCTILWTIGENFIVEEFVVKHLCKLFSSN